MRTIYLDHAAATPLRKEVLSAMLPFLNDAYGNPSSLHRKGREAYDAIEKSRSGIASLLNVQAREIVFTGSGTEANNLALFGAAYANESRGKHILVSSIEHPSVLEAAERLKESGFEIEHLPVDAHGLINVNDTIARIRKDTIIVSVMYANNEIGTIQPIRELGMRMEELPHQRPFLHTDACQAIGQLPVSPHALGVDLLTLNGSKAYGPKGTGVLYVRDGIRLTPRTVGGGQERGVRAGTENVAGIVGMATALIHAVRNEWAYRDRLTVLRDKFTERIKAVLPEAVINGHPTLRLPNNIHLSIPFIEGESLLLLLDTYGICASTGSACSSHNLAPSHVLRAIGQSPEIMHGSIRFTLGDATHEGDIEYVVAALKASAEHLKQMSPLPLTL